jgi:hypothetical protein
MIKPYANEVLEKIDAAKGKKKEAMLLEYGAQHPWNMILSLNFDETLELDLPEGMPPYNKVENEHPDTYQTLLHKEIKRLAPLLKGRSPDLHRHRKQHIFIQILEGIPPKEAELLCFVKDKALTEMYPTITRELVEKHFPIYCRRKVV